jgi:hypothetical protein
LTKKKMEVQKTVIVQNQGAYSIEVLRPQLKFKPGFPYEFSVVIRKADGRLDTSSGNVEVEATFKYGKDRCTFKDSLPTGIKSLKYSFDEELELGKANFKLDIPNNTTTLSLSVTYFGSKNVVNVTRFPSRTREYLEVEVRSK